MNGNQIKTIAKNVFVGLNKLKFVDLRSNATINVVFATAEYKISVFPTSVRVFKASDLNALIRGIYVKKSCNNVCEDLAKALKSDDSKDFTIEIEEVELKVHKFIP